MPRLVSTAAAVGALATFVYFHGFACAPWVREVEAGTVAALLCAFSVGAWGRWHTLATTRSRWCLAEPVLTSMVAIAGIYRVWLGQVPDRSGSPHLELLAVHTALLVLAGVVITREVARPVSDRMLSLRPAVAFALSYVALSGLGACLLMLPEMTTGEGSLTPLDAAFTSVSASCVTGLIVVDTATQFSVKGQAVVLLLIQLGGLNVISFATYFLIYGARARPTGADRVEVEEFLHADARTHLYRTLALTAVASLSIELIATLAIYLGWGDVLSAAGESSGLFSAFFHSVSAFNNAGFSLHTDGLTSPVLRPALGLHAVLAGLIVLGGLGIPVLSVIVRRRVDAACRVAVSWGATLLVGGAICYWSLEGERTLDGEAALNSAVAAVFQSVTARTAGFSTVDIASLSSWTLALLGLLMFVGASTGSTGGGIKTSTAAVLVAGATDLARGRVPTLMGMRVSSDVMRKAVWITGLAVVTIVVGTGALAWVEPDTPLGDLVFEEVSAFGTVGLSTGVTSGLSDWGKGVVMSTMLIGRIGPLAFGLSLLGRRVARRVHHTDFLVG